MIPSPLLLVTDRHGSARSLTDTVRAVLDGGARWIWFRDKDLPPEPRRDLALDVLALVREAGGCLTIGGNAALAEEIGADGLHLGSLQWDDRPARPSLSHPRPHPETPDRSGGLEGGLQMSPRSLEPSFEAHSRGHLRMRESVGESFLIGVSAHSLADIRNAAEAGADYVTLSPIFSTPSKPGYGPALGLDALRRAAGCGIPVLALGGIGSNEAAACRQAGAAGVAVMGGLMRAADPAGETRRLLRSMA